MKSKQLDYIPTLKIAGMVFAIALTAIGVASAQEAKKPNDKTTPQEFVKVLNSNSDLAVQEAETQWRKRLVIFRQSTRAASLAERLVSYQQKFASVGQFFGAGSNSEKSIRIAIREGIVDEKELIGQMKQFVNDMLQGFRQQDASLMRALGQSESVANQGLCSHTFDSREWDKSFEAFVQSAIGLSNRDLARSAAVFAGSNLASDAINDSARNAGLNPHEDGSVSDFFVDLLVNVVVGAVADAMTDPTAANLEQITSDLRTLERALFDGPKGIITILRSANEKHKQARLKLVAQSANGGAK